MLVIGGGGGVVGVLLAPSTAVFLILALETLVYAAFADGECVRGEALALRWLVTAWGAAGRAERGKG